MQYESLTEDVIDDYLLFLKEHDPDKYKEMIEIEQLLNQHNQLLKDLPCGRS